MPGAGAGLGLAHLLRRHALGQEGLRPHRPVVALAGGQYEPLLRFDIVLIDIAALEVHETEIEDGPGVAVPCGAAAASDTAPRSIPCASASFAKTCPA